MSAPSQKPSNAYQVVIPQLGLTMQEATITEWLHNDGDWVEKGQPLFTLENEKSTVEVEAPASGRLAIEIPAGETVPVLHPVALIEGEGQVADHHAVRKAEQQRDGESKPEREAVDAQVRNQLGQLAAASPRARIKARKKGLDLSGIRGTGIRGMITLQDIEGLEPQADREVLVSPIARSLAKSVQVDLQEVQGSGPQGMIMREDVEKTIRTQLAQPTKEPLSGLSGLRGVIARRLSQSWQERPHVTLTTEVDVSQLVALRKQVNSGPEEERSADDSGIRISYNALLIKLCAVSLEKHLYMNASLTEEGIEEHSQIHIGFAVDTERGLMVPVIRNVLKKSLVTIQIELQELAERARAGSSLPDELTGGTFTITNLGAYGIDAFTPVINPPESAVLGVGRILERPVGVEGKVVLREMMVLSLTFDHRLIDGAPAASFMRTLTGLIQTPPAPGGLLEKQGDLT